MYWQLITNSSDILQRIFDQSYVHSARLLVYIERCNGKTILIKMQKTHSSINDHKLNFNEIVNQKVYNVEN